MQAWQSRWSEPLAAHSVPIAHDVGLGHLLWGSFIIVTVVLVRTYLLVLLGM